MVKLVILSGLVLMSDISLLILKDLHLLLLSYFSRCISPIRHLCIPSKCRLSIWASRAEVQEADMGVDQVAEDSHSLLVLSRLVVVRLGCSL